MIRFLPGEEIQFDVGEGITTGTIIRVSPQYLWATLPNGTVARVHRVKHNPTYIKEEAKGGKPSDLDKLCEL
jgi:hypothetical protein